MKRRQFVIAVSSLGLLSGCGMPLNPRRSPAVRTSRVGILDGSALNDAVATAHLAGLEQGLTHLGYVDGLNIIFELRNANGNFDELPELANELVRLPVDVIVSIGTSDQGAIAARAATTVIPIVFVEAGDPIGDGLVVSLAHPGGNVTGDTNVPPSVSGKQLDILTQLVPGLSRIGILADFEPANVGIMTARVQAITDVANALGVQVKTLAVRAVEDVESSLAAALTWPAEAIMDLGAPGTVTNATPRLVEFTRQHRVPMICNGPAVVRAGALLGYGANAAALGQLAATFVDKIIKGANPRDLPVQEPTTFDFIVNQTTAQAIGITIPPEVAQQVTQWVQ